MACQQIAVIPYEHGQRQLRHISDVNVYKKLHNTLPAAVLAALRARVKHGNPKGPLLSESV